MQTVELRLAALESAKAAVEQQLATLSAEQERLKRRLRGWQGAACLLLLVGLLLGPPQMGQAQGTLDQRVVALETKLARVFVVNGGNDIIISGANLNIINGGGSTQTANGLGNLIIGYNEARGGGADFRGGSHNLVLGQQSNYLSFGGIIGGYQNTISGPFAHVLTGYQNGALSFYACVTTGQGNNAANNYASVSGGINNTASGPYSLVSGGSVNTASGIACSVSGGSNNTASGSVSSVSGGLLNTASGTYSSVSGGEVNTASGFASSVSGGIQNTASSTYSVVSGGSQNTAAAVASTVGGGTQETILAMPASNDYDWRAAAMLFADAPP
jgi:hypothetical protein